MFKAQSQKSSVTPYYGELLAKSVETMIAQLTLRQHGRRQFAVCFRNLQPVDDKRTNDWLNYLEHVVVGKKFVIKVEWCIRHDSLDSDE